jgi:hypothetical protein
MVADPALTPVTSPADDTLAISGFELDHVPPEVALVKLDALFTQTAFAPLITLTELGVNTFTDVACELAEQPFVPVTVTLYEPEFETVILAVVAPVLHVYDVPVLAVNTTLPP